jgi:hypothetical protein
MMTTFWRACAVVALMLVCLLSMSGCTTGYITASVQSVIGLDVSENPHTQVPHVRFGYIRSQYYYVPTGKYTGSQTEGSADKATDKASDTPELVSSIDIDISFGSSSKIKEKFAIGKTAVTSLSAGAMFDPEGKVVGKIINPERNALVRQIGILIQDKAKEEKAKTCIAKDFPDYPIKVFIMFGPPGFHPWLRSGGCRTGSNTVFGFQFPVFG